MSRNTGKWDVHCETGAVGYSYNFDGCFEDLQDGILVAHHENGIRQVINMRNSTRAIFIPYEVTQSKVQDGK